MTNCDWFFNWFFPPPFPSKTPLPPLLTAASCSLLLLLLLLLLLPVLALCWCSSFTWFCFLSSFFLVALGHSRCSVVAAGHLSPSCSVPLYPPFVLLMSSSSFSFVSCSLILRPVFHCCFFVGGSFYSCWLCSYRFWVGLCVALRLHQSPVPSRPINASFCHRSVAFIGHQRNHCNR